MNPSVVKVNTLPSSSSMVNRSTSTAERGSTPVTRPSASESLSPQLSEKSIATASMRNTLVVKYRCFIYTRERTIPID